MDITLAHWIYLVGIIVIIAVMILRKNVVVPAVAATFLTAWAFSGNFVTGLTSVFNASLVSAKELFSIFLIIALVTALLGSLRAMGADRRLVQPFKKLMRNGSGAFLILFGVTYVISLFFWPTPAVPLIGAILLPAAIQAGLPAMGAAVAIAIAGQGMALSSDYIIQVAPGLSAVAAGVPTSGVADRALVLSLITGVVAIVIAFLRLRRSITEPDPALLDAWEHTTVTGRMASSQTTSRSEQGVVGEDGGGAGTTAATLEDLDVPASAKTGGARLDFSWGADNGEPVARSKAFAVIVPIAFGLMVLYMVLGKFTDLVPESSGSDAAALVGGVSAVLLLAASLTLDGPNALETCAEHVVDGLVFAFKAMGVVLPIAGFFFIGNADFAAQIMSMGDDAKPPSFLFDLVSSAQNAIPQASILVAFGILIIGIITGLDGSGFSGLPLTGSLSGALGPTTGMDPSTLAAIGQMGSIWSGGGTLVAWSSLLAVAGFARVDVLELARKLFVPVVAGLVVSTIVAVVIY